MSDQGQPVEGVGGSTGSADRGNQTSWWHDVSGEVAAQVSSAKAAADAAQPTAETFIQSHGADVVDGHGFTPGTAGDVQV